MEASETLTACILEMAEAETNPVLEILDVNEPLVENKKYPPDLLQFKQLGWRAYYHCHPASRAGNHRFEDEHGHFHIFVRAQNTPEKWSHLVALAMNNMGQPLGWFTVNHWVTAETWLDADVLYKSLKTIPYGSTESIKTVERWLLSLLAISCDKVEFILHERDKILQQQQLAQKEIDIKNNKDIYLLSEIPINLIKLLEED